MFGRNIDFLAVLIIGAMMMAFSALGSLRVPDLTNSIRLQHAVVNIDSCPTAREVLTRLGLVN